MRRSIWVALIVAVCAMFAAAPASAKGTRRASGSHRTSHSTHTYRAPRTRTYSPRTYTRSTRRSRKSSEVIVGRDANGRIHRSEAAKDAFMRQTGYPHGRKGYVVDHVVPLACGGADAPSNMQWQSAADAKAKDKIERKGCN